jgi:hypothetical protein
METNKIRRVPGDWTSIDQFKSSSAHQAISDAIVGFTPGEIDIVMEYKLIDTKIWIKYQFETAAKVAEFKSYILATDSSVHLGQSAGQLGETIAQEGWVV